MFWSPDDDMPPVENPTAAAHRDWHTIAALEGVSRYECPWDCVDPADEEPEPTYATVWYTPPGMDEERGYPVATRSQMRAFASTAAARTGRPVRVEIERAA